MNATFVLNKIKTYGIRNLFYRMLIRIIPNNLNYLYFLFRKYVFGYAIFHINGVKMHLDLKNDDGLSKELLLLGKRERFTVDHLLSTNVVKEGDTVLDIGANIGYYALPESNLVGTTGKVYAVEPVGSNHALLKKNVELNNMKNITTYQMAMGDVEKDIEIYVREKKNLSSLTALPADEQGGVARIETVPMTTVDAFAEKIMGKMPDFVRMDVEGYEASILEGMHKTLESGATLLIEFHPMFLSAESKERIVALFKKYNYSRIVATVNPKGELNAVLKFLNKKIGTEGKPSGYTTEGDLDYLHTLLFTSPRVVNAFVYQK